MAKTARKTKTVKKTRRAKKKTFLQLIQGSWFYRIYFGLLALCAVALVIGLIVLSGVLSEYEQTRPIHSAEATLDLFNRRDWAEIRQLDQSAQKLKQETPEQYAQYMDELTDGKEFTLKSILSINENEQKYNLLADGQKFAELTLEPSGQITSHKFEGWKLKTLETLAFQASEYTITVPSDSTVQVNGLTLGTDDILESDIAVDLGGNLPDGIAAPTLTKYGVYMSFGKPENIIVTDKNGNAQEVTQDDERSWSCGLPYDDSIKSKVEDSVVKWGRRLAAYTSNDYNKFDLSEACVNPSPARTYIRNMENQWAATHSGYDFQNIETYDYYVYSDSCFSCKISFDYIIHYTKEDKLYPTKYTLYFFKDGGNFKLYSFTMDS